MLDNKTFPAVLAKLEEHVAAGHEVIIVSASFDAYLQFAANRLGVSSLICTQIEIVDGVCTGRLVDDVNVRSHKKTELLTKALGEEPVELYAYGNSSGDVPMLAAAQHPFWVTKKGEVEVWNP